jgi:hypothetical protein
MKNKDNMPTWSEAMLEVEGLVNEEVSKLTKQGDVEIVKILMNSLKVIKRGINMNKFIMLHIEQTTPKKRSGFVYRIKKIFNSIFKRRSSNGRV